MSRQSTTRSAYSMREILGSFVALQWLILMSMVVLNVLLHWRNAGVLRIIEAAWAVSLLFLAAFLFSARVRMAIRIAFFLNSAFMLAYLTTCTVTGGVRLAGILFLLYMYGITFNAFRQFIRDGVLFGAMRLNQGCQD